MADNTASRHRIDGPLLNAFSIYLVTLKQTLAELESLGNEKVRAMHKKNGADEDMYGAKNHPGKEALRLAWMHDADPWAARAAWNLTAEHIGKGAEGVDLPALLERIESELANAPAPTQWTMHNCLAGIGIHFPEYRQRALAIGERLGVYRDYPVSKGCTSPFAPVWIAEMVMRKA